MLREKRTIFYYLGIALLSSASLIFEVSLTRILSVAQGHHFAFLIVSTALLGIGASGSYLMLHTRRYRELPTMLLIAGPVLFSVTTIASYLILNRIPFDLVRLAWEPRQLGLLILAYGILAVPFFFSGLTIATALTRMAHQAGKIYFSDLLGATTGALLPLALYPVMGATGAVMLAGLLGLVAGLFLWWSVRPVKIPPLLILLSVCSMVLLAGYWIHPAWYDIQLSPYKGLRMALHYPEAQHLSSRWNILSRIDVVKSPAVRFAPGLSLTYAGKLPRQIGFSLDGDQLHAITAYESREDLEFLRHLPSAASYSMLSPERVLIIEPGGGLDILTALYFDVPSIEVVERNPALLEVVRQPVPDFPSRIYEDRRVTVHLTEARSYLSARDSRFDLIVLSPLHVLGASALGLYGFAEDYSLTREAVETYYRHLSEEGWLAITRYLQPVPLQEIRLAATLIETLEGLGVSNPGQHLIALRSWGTITFLLKHAEISRQDIKRLKGFSESLRFDLDYYPGVKPEEVNRFNRFPEATYYQLIMALLDPKERVRLYQDYPFNIQPVTDDRPFFGYVLRMTTMKETYHLVREKWLFFIEGGFLLPVMLLQALFFAVVLIMLPAAFGMAGVKTSPFPIRKSYILLYFMLIGLAFMGVEIAMIQRLILFLGHPVYAISAVLSSLLLFAGLGSLITSFRAFPDDRGRRPILFVLSLIVLSEGIGLPWALPHMMGFSVSGRFLATVIFLAPLGILMGMPFPLGIRYLKRSAQEAIIPWAWAANGSASVVGAILAVMIAMEIGFSVVFAAAALAYAAAAWCLSPFMAQKAG